MIELKSASSRTLEFQPRLNFLEIAFARSRQEAMRLRSVLRDAAILADIEPGESPRRGVAVLVESSNLVSASEILVTHAQASSASINGAFDDDDDEFDDDDDDFSDDDDYDKDNDDDYFVDDDDDDDDDFANDDEE